MIRAWRWWPSRTCVRPLTLRLAPQTGASYHRARVIELRAGAASVEFAIEVRRDAERTTLLMSGAMDLDTAHVFTRALEKACAAGAREIVLDLQGVDFIDSLGLHTILRGRAYCAKLGCGYWLRPTLPPRVQRTFAVAGVGEYIPFQPEGQLAASKSGG